MKNNQKGFGVIEALVIMLIVGLVGFGGWYVWHKGQKEDSKNTTANSKTTEDKKEAEKPIYTLPEGYQWYENKELGFKFAYPATYGKIADTETVDNIRIRMSDQPTEAYGPGINGRFRIFTYGSADTAIIGRKYGPRIQLQGDKWIVTEPNESDLVGNKKGDVYRDFEKKVPASQKNGGLTVYTLRSGDEGSFSDRLAFVANGKLHEIYLPSFSDGTYGGGEANDMTAFTKLQQEVRSSVTLLK